MSDVAEHPPEVGTPDQPRRSRRRLVVGLAAAVVVAAVGSGVAIVATVGAGDRGDDTAQTFRGATDEVSRGDLESSTSTSGTLRFADARTIQSGRGGVVTGLPTPGAVVTFGGELYAVDNVPVFLLRGGMPAWRDFESGMDKGPDVQQLEESLRDLGFFTKPPDQEFSWFTTDAIQRWQKANGLAVTGRLPLGSVLFSGGDLRIGTVKAKVGDQTGQGGELFATTATTRIVDATLKLANQQLAVVGAKVGLNLPGGTRTTGTFSSVGTPTEKPGAGEQKETVIPVVVTLDDPAAAGSLQEASVTVSVPSARREDVLSVPVGALLAISPDEFGVEVVQADGTTRKVAVKTGLFAGGRVEVSGDGLEAGQRVVVPKR
ncbi:peptidoglycan-binding protein [Umezawaea endophytica]|uniref:Peptidoglycan-binding protein n=1 Tax=Umezawaea endophytica TaxID=1654476 RepID=A0A9X2VN65_9PSEU|nr:peptidoglycan-binding protein [Umezawaea endophytica]MCS7479214.1 peptidoglycan-binding protein [Umezawaea endophytica]